MTTRNFRHWQDWLIVLFLFLAGVDAWDNDYPRANYYLLVAVFIAVVHLPDHNKGVQE